MYYTTILQVWMKSGDEEQQKEIHQTSQEWIPYEKAMMLWEMMPKEVNFQSFCVEDKIVSNPESYQVKITFSTVYGRIGFCVADLDVACSKEIGDAIAQMMPNSSDTDRVRFFFGTVARKSKKALLFGNIQFPATCEVKVDEFFDKQRDFFLVLCGSDFVRKSFASHDITSLSTLIEESEGKPTPNT